MSLYRWNNIVKHISSFNNFYPTVISELYPENLIYPNGSVLLENGKYKTPVHTSKNAGEFRVYFDSPLYYSVFCSSDRLLDFVVVDN